MSKNKALKVVNLILTFLVANQFVSVFLFQKGVIPYPGFEWMHKRVAFMLLAVAVAHLVLNWNWVKANYFTKKEK